MAKSISEILSWVRNEVEETGECTLEVNDEWEEHAGYDPIQVYFVYGFAEASVISAVKAAGLKIGRLVGSNNILVTQ